MNRNKLSFIKMGQSLKFIQQFNKNKASDEFLKSCSKAGRLIKRKDGRQC